jgi:RecA/RadA recombinase
MDLLPGEPECGPWRPTSPTELHDLVVALPAPPTGPRIVAIDGRGGSGKTVLAREIAATAARSGRSAAVVHTDDVAWYQSFFGWDELLAEHVLAPVRAGRGAGYRPRSWQDRGRPGGITVPADAALVVVEGSGSTRGSLAPWLDATIWVQVDTALAEDRLRERDGDTPEIRRHVAEWLREEEPFMLREQPWSRCRWVVGSTRDGGWRLGRPAPGG